jgi:peptidyl-dipeptidase A
MGADPTTLAADLDALFRPLDVELAEAWWDCNTHASPENDRRREELELRRRDELSDPDRYAAVRTAASGAEDGVTRRVLEVVASAMGPNQVDADLRRRLVELESRIESTFVQHRGEIDGERVGDNRIEEILTSSDDVGLRRQAWEASKSVGAAVVNDLLTLVDVRNEAARRLGHRDHYAMALSFDDLDEDRLFATLAEVEDATGPAFATWKRALDERLADRFGCAVDDLRPWHYDDPFFQELPVTGRVDLDPLFAEADVEALTVRTYEALGLDIAPALERSDLYARDHKSQHAFCISIDREQDVRVLCNVLPNERWMSTMLHEFGHAIYDLEVDGSLPFLLREPPHLLATEAVAMLFGRLVRDPSWLAAVAGATGEETDAATEAQRAGMLVFARWAMVMVHFERGLYRDPGGDHAARWWDLVERFQGVRRPDGRTEPDWASKVHLAVAPVYYQNYLYGELVASQLSAALHRDAGGIVDLPAAGRWLTDRFFRPGASLRWDRLVEHATGAPLSPGHFVTEFVG